MRAYLFASLLAIGSCRPVLPVPQFRIDLDVDPEERFKEVLAHFKAPLSDLFNTLANNSVVKSLCNKIAKHRGPENAELAAEIRGISKYSGIPETCIATAQLLYELQTVMVPIENITWPWGETTQSTGQIPSFGCTGIIARSADDGTVTHARNLDFSFAKWLANMTYNAVYYKNGTELFTAQQIAAYSMPLTGMRRGKNGYTIEINTRYPPKQTNVKNIMKHLFEEKRVASGWIKRQVLRDIDNFEDAVKAFSTKPYASTEYNIISGNQKGVILARDPDSLYHKLTLGPNKNDYIIMTNFDYWDHDIKEWFDPTSMHMFHSRRIGAERILNKSKNIDFNQLYAVMNNMETIAKDTIFQMFANVQKDTYKTFLPDCEDCSGCVDGDVCLKKGEDCCGVRSFFTHKCGVTGGYKCGCVPDGTCRAHHKGDHGNSSHGDMDCCSFQSHATLKCPFGRMCGAKPSNSIEFV